MSLRYAIRFCKSLWQSLRQSFANNEEIKNIVEHNPRVTIFLKERFDHTKFTGLFLTVLSIAFIYVLLLFLGVIEDMVTSDIVVSADVHVNTLLYAFRNALAVKVFFWVTLLGESPVIVVFSLVVSVILYLSYKKFSIATLWLTIIGSELFTFFAKIVFHRPRPGNAVFSEVSASFPSGHATMAVAFYGFIVYLSWRVLKKKKYRILVGLFGILIILMIGLSRIYLGVHYVSDVWAGYLVGLLWLIIGVALTEWRFFKDQHADNIKKYFGQKAGIANITLIVLAFIFFGFYGFFYQPQFTLKMPEKPVLAATTPADIFSDFNLPRYTETIIGKFQEPISFLIIAKSDDALLLNFQKAGWSLADIVGIKSTLSLSRSVIFNKEYSTAPMTPSFWNKQVHDFGFEKSTSAKSARQRHHARFWKTNLLTEQGENIYVGTVSLDTGIKWLITHQISPDIDTERDKLFIDFQQAGNVKDYLKIQLVNPVLGKNFSGDQFFTDGKFYVVKFGNE